MAKSNWSPSIILCSIFLEGLYVILKSRISTELLGIVRKQTVAYRLESLVLLAAASDKYFSSTQYRTHDVSIRSAQNLLICCEWLVTNLIALDIRLLTSSRFSFSFVHGVAGLVRFSIYSLGSDFDAFLYHSVLSQTLNVTLGFHQLWNAIRDRFYLVPFIFIVYWRSLQLFICMLIKQSYDVFVAACMPEREDGLETTASALFKVGVKRLRFLRSWR